MLEVKVKGQEVSVYGEAVDGYLTECAAAVHAIAALISENEGIDQSVALRALCSVAIEAEKVFDTHRNRTVVCMPRGVKRNADD